MNAERNPLVSLRQSMEASQRQFDSACLRAGEILEARLTEIAGDVQRTASKVASLESNLEIFDGLEQTRMAAQTRREIASAMDYHRGTVDGAKARLQHAWQDYRTAIIAAAANLAGPNNIPKHVEG